MFKAYYLFWKYYININAKSKPSEFWWAFFWNWLIRIVLAVWWLLGASLIAKILLIIYLILGFIPSLTLIARRYKDAGVNRIFMMFTCLCPWIAYGLVKLTVNSDAELGKIILNLSGLGFFVCLVTYFIIAMFPTMEHSKK